MQLLLFPHHPPSVAGPSLLEPADRAAVLEILLRGGSPQAACQRLGLSVADFCRTVEEDDDFRRRLRQLRELMTHNVVAVVYAAAMKGTPAAQALWLRTFPPADGSDSETTSLFHETSDDLALRSDEEIEREIEACRQARFESPRPGA